VLTGRLVSGYVGKQESGQPWWNYVYYLLYLAARGEASSPGFPRNKGQIKILKRRFSVGSGRYSVYGYTAGELLSAFVSSERGPFDQIDLKPSCNVLSPLGDLLSTTVSDLEKCTIAQAHPEWLVR
jgi:hypothetical protein